MTIDREKLIQLLVAKTGYDRERVETQLSELISRIHEAASEGKSFEIEGFGIFTLEDDELNFEPADELKTEINHKYAGMEPIELIGAYGETEEEEEAEGQEPRTETEAEAGEPIEKDAETAGPELETSTSDSEPETAEEEEEAELASEADDEGAEAGGEEKEIWGIDDASSLSDEISKARTEKWEKAQQEKGEQEDAEEVRDAEPVVDTETSDEDIDEVLKSLEDETMIGGEEEEEQEEQIEFDDLERALAEEEQETGQEAAESGPTERWEPGTELKSSQPEERRAKPEPKHKAKARRKPAGKKKDPIGTILTVFLILIIVGVGGWFAYDMGVFSGIASVFSGDGDPVASTVQPQPSNQAPSQQQNQSQPQPQDPTQQPSQDQGAEPGGGVPNQQQPADADQQQQQPSGEDAEPQSENAVATGTENGRAGSGQPLYGLNGPVNPDANNGYTIVVYSLQNETRARRLQNDLSDEGYRALLTDAVVNGNEYWRVGLGQFATVNDAQAAALDLREPFRNNFFIRRIE